MSDQLDDVEQEISKLKIDEDTVVNLKDSKARGDIDEITKQISISDEDFAEIFTSTN